MSKIKYYLYRIQIERIETIKDGLKHYISRLAPSSNNYTLKKTDEMYQDDVGDWYVLIEPEDIDG